MEFLKALIGKNLCLANSYIGIFSEIGLNSYTSQFGKIFGDE